MDNNTYTSASDFDIRLTPQYRQAAMSGKFNQVLPPQTDSGYQDAVNKIHPGIHAQVMTDMYNNPTTMTALDDNTRQQVNMFMSQQRADQAKYDQIRQMQQQQQAAQQLQPDPTYNPNQQLPESPRASASANMNAALQQSEQQRMQQRLMQLQQAGQVRVQPSPEVMSNTLQSISPMGGISNPLLNKILGMIA